VPAQIVGRDVKEALKVDLEDLAMEVYGYRPWIGTTLTGFTDSFTSFGPAGPVAFGAIAAFLASFWRRAVSGSLSGQYFYCILITTGLHAITHGTAWFVAFLPQAFGFSWVVFRWAQIERAPSAHPVGGPPARKGRDERRRVGPSFSRAARKPQAVAADSSSRGTKP
jgi:hypothetical protein